MKSTMIGLLALAGLFVGVASAHDRSERSTASPTLGRTHTGEHDAKGPKTAFYLSSDKAFLWRMHWVNHSEIQAGELAKVKGTTEGVQEYGADLMSDHRQAENDLAALATKKDIDLELTREEYTPLRGDLSEHMTAVMDLAHESGLDFDRKFLTHMVQGHAEAIDLAKAYRKKTTDKEVRAHIDEVLPTLTKHHKTAKDLLDKVEGARQPVRGEDVDPAKKDTKTRTTDEKDPPDEEGHDPQQEIEEDIERRTEPEEMTPDLPLPR